MKTDMDTLKNADWDQLERDVVSRIRVLRAYAENADGDVNNRIANDLILPNLKLLAAFCEAIGRLPDGKEMA